jgi:hypothetical protein
MARGRTSISNVLASLFQLRLPRQKYTTIGLTSGWSRLALMRRTPIENCSTGQYSLPLDADRRGRPGGFQAAASMRESPYPEKGIFTQQANEAN